MTYDYYDTVAATPTTTDFRSRAEVERDPQPGDIYVNSWGYDQTNIDYYQVVKRTPGTVTIRKIGVELIDRRVFPVRDKFITDYRDPDGKGKVCHLKTKDPKPGYGLKTGKHSFTWAFPYEGGGRYDTIAAGDPGH
jgi:hypothetical protein